MSTEQTLTLRDEATQEIIVRTQDAFGITSEQRIPDWATQLGGVSSSAQQNYAQQAQNHSLQNGYGYSAGQQNLANWAQYGVITAIYSTAYTPSLGGYTGAFLSPNNIGILGRTRQRTRVAASKAFALVKRCIKSVTRENAEYRAAKAASFAQQAKDNGQQALYEELSQQFLAASTEVKLAQAGFTTFINKKAVYGFAARTKGAADSKDELFQTPVENFGRPIPEGPAKRLKVARATGLFQGFTVLHAGAAMIKTTAQKIREKDPILFGMVATHPDRLYVIADWIDELCHLTVSELLMHPEFAGSLEAVDVDEAAMQAETLQRAQLLAGANSRTWQDNEKAAKKLEVAPPAIRKGWQFWK